MPTIGEYLASHGKRTRVYCGCLGWISGHKRSTQGVTAVSPKGTRTYCKCLECGKVWHYANRP